MQMIDNSLTVNIEQDMYERTGKAPPKHVNRAGSSPKRASTAGKQRPAATSYTKSSVGKPEFRQRMKDPIDFRLHD